MVTRPLLPNFEGGESLLVVKWAGDGNMSLWLWHIPSDLVEMIERGDSGSSMIVERAIMFWNGLVSIGRCLLIGKIWLLQIYLLCSKNYLSYDDPLQRMGFVLVKLKTCYIFSKRREYVRYIPCTLGSVSIHCCRGRNGNCCSLTSSPSTANCPPAMVNRRSSVTG
jgi:hypothetical protein